MEPALPLLCSRATPHLVCPSHTSFFSPKDIICTLHACFPLPPPLPAFSLHLFPWGVCPFSQAPRTRERERFWELVWPACCSERCPGSGEQPRAHLSCTNSTGRNGRGMLLGGSDPIRVCSGGSFRNTTGDIPYYSPTLGPDLPCIYRQGNSPSCFSFPLHRTTVTIFTLLLHRSIFRIN